MSAARAERPLLLADRGCPYAHRVLAVLEHVGAEYDTNEAPLGHLPEGLERWSSSGRIPLLVHGAVTVGESRVMMEYVAESFAFQDAYPADLALRTQHRQAMALMDGVVAPNLVRSPADERVDARLAECLDVFEDTVRATTPSACLLTFHFAPIWLRFQWWRPDGGVTRALLGRPMLSEWLDRATTLPAVLRTSPTRAENVADFRAACAALAKGATP